MNMHQAYDLLMGTTSEPEKEVEEEKPVPKQSNMHKELIRDKAVYVARPIDGKPEIFQFPSQTLKDVTYTLRVMPDGELRCACKFFVFTGKKCIHIDKFTQHRKTSDHPFEEVKEEPTVDVVNELTQELGEARAEVIDQKTREALSNETPKDEYGIPMINLNEPPFL